MKFIDYIYDEVINDDSWYKVIYHSTNDDEKHCYRTEIEYRKALLALKELKDREDVDCAEIQAYWERYFQCVIKRWKRA